MTAHCYADDTQVYVCTPPTDVPAAVAHFRSCVEQTERWLQSNRLKMNAEKTQVIWLGTRQQLEKVNIDEIQLSSARIPVSIDSQLTMSEHVASVCRSCCFQLRQLRAVRRSITMDAAKTLVHAFVGGRTDYCNSLLAGISDSLIRRMQLVQNAAARLVTGLRKFDHVKPTLRDLHWLPVRQRINYKVALLVYKCLHGLAPSYLADDCRPVSTMAGRRQLRSADTGMLVVPRTRTSIGARSFAVRGPTVWNKLPVELRHSGLSADSFTKRLKTYFMDNIL
jgi:alpha-D-ribose 1-methylphosphonate 5-triphosphate synthase subunit PhnG